MLIGLYAALPFAIRLSMIQFLPRLGFDIVEVGGVDFNPLFGIFAIHDLKLKRNGETVLSGRQIEVDLAMPALFERRIMLEVLRIKGVTLALRTEPDAAVEVAGVPLPHGDAGDGVNGGKASAGPGWGVGWQGIVIEDVTVQHLQQGVETKFSIANAYLDRAASWRPNADSHLQISGRIDQAEVKIHARFQPFSPALNVDAGLRIDALDGGHFAAFAPMDIKDLAGQLSIAGQLRLTLGDKGPSMDYEGEVGLKRFGAGYGDYVVHNDDLDLDGRFTLDSANDGAVTWSGDLALAGLTVKASSGPLLDLEKLTAAGARQTPNGDISVDRVAISGAHARIAVDTKGRLNLSASAETNASATPAQTAPQKTTSPKITEPTSPTPLVWIGGVELSDSRIDIEDRSVKPTFHSRISIESLALGKLDSSLPDMASDWSLKAAIDKFSRLDVHGKIRPFSDQLDLTVLGTLRGLPLPTLSGYSAMSIGYFVDSGQADADIDVAVVKGALSGKIGMRLARLEVSPAAEDKIKALTAQLSMPLPSALSILKNDDDEITLSLPLSGNMAAPDFGVAPLINKLLGIALKRAAIAYLSNLLQPYATVFTVAELAYDVASKIALDPLIFVDGQANIAADSAPYVGKLGKLLSERPELTLRLCGFAAQGDAEALAAAANKVARDPSGKKQEPVPPPKTAAPEDALPQLAAARAEWIKHVLVEQYQIDQGRLFLCRPQVDEDPKGRPRVELSI